MLKSDLLGWTSMLRTMKQIHTCRIPKVPPGLQVMGVHE